MRPYIENLTNHLIKKNGYAQLLSQTCNQNDFIKHVKRDLYSIDARDMNPATLGKIMCSFDRGDVMASKMDLFEGVRFNGDCEDMLRELVSLCLAYTIWESTINGNSVSAILHKLWPSPNNEQQMVILICELTAPENISQEELIKGAKSIVYHYRPSTEFDDDCYRMGQSPFDKKWYIFASVGSFFRTTPDYILDKYPRDYDNLETMFCG